ncbi:hypothetical protein AAFN88_06990 [Pelagibius sp. CAU 1746]|uniref:hypothetical protein n=1 Tax=Pelagibius sp. CAU 1746 TaxID=3140370 RepID=UPI00325C1225
MNDQNQNQGRGRSKSRGRPAPPGLLLTDLYQLNMMQAYEEAGMAETAVFELFVRKLPETRIMNLLHFETVIASKAARLRLAAGG